MNKFIDKLSERERKGEKERERLNIKIIGSVCACEKKKS